MGLIKCDKELLSKRYNLSATDECYYFLDYTDGGYSASSSNQLVFNFKQPISKRGTASWRYREESVQKFANLISEIQGLCENKFTIVIAPTSKRTDSPDYNDRIDKTLELFKKYCPTVIIERPIEVIRDTIPSHDGGNRDEESIKNNLKWVGFKYPPTAIVVFIDDILTTGTHFKVSKEIILQNDSRVERVVGVFLALYSYRE
ncbi:MAG: Unknown protein [uncultured Sulfurovum sp.]|uniref:Amidophosphoribosyltransferase n=1 Tax=uncultured Sulfurovum sp. TaxID=269237 RepID=A0A6S6SAX5_9BACT|nr:MAG: Unknown protein [uncultured Sulfurovum sp.]